MELKYRNFPYPVLSPYSDDYADSSFSAEIQYKERGYYFLFSCWMKLENNDLKKLIEQRDAVFALHLEDPKTSLRKVIKSFRSEFSFQIPTGSLDGVLQITPFITAEKEIRGYSSSTFHPDYNGLQFDLEAGNILAYFPTITIRIDKSFEDLSERESMFSIVKNLDENSRTASVNYENSQKIAIQLPLESFEYFLQLNQNPENNDILNSMVIVPALVYVLGALQMRSTEEREELEEYKWYRVMKKMLNEKFGIDITSDKFSEQNVFHLAQELSDFSLYSGLSSLFSMNSLEEDDE